MLYFLATDSSAGYPTQGRFIAPDNTSAVQAHSAFLNWGRTRWNNALTHSVREITEVEYNDSLATTLPVYTVEEIHKAPKKLKIKMKPRSQSNGQ